jgi:hypothetical protein
MVWRQSITKHNKDSFTYMYSFSVPFDSTDGQSGCGGGGLVMSRKKPTLQFRKIDICEKNALFLIKLSART